MSIKLGLQNVNQMKLGLQNVISAFLGTINVFNSYVLNISGSKGLVYDSAGGTLVNSRTSTATVIDYTGALLTLPANTIRLSGARYVNHADAQTYNTGANNGWEAFDTMLDGFAIAPKPVMLSEGAGTNFLKYSENLPAWALSDVSLGNINNTSNLTLYQLIDSTVTNQHRVSKSLVVSNNTDYTLSAYFKAATERYCIVWCHDLTNNVPIAMAYFDLLTGTVAQVDYGTANVTATPNGVFRCSVSANSGTSSTYLVILQACRAVGSVNYAGTVTPAIEVGNAQLEVGLQETSYIPTTTAPVPRSADVISLPLISGTNFNISEGVLLFRFIPGYDFKNFAGNEIFSVKVGQGFLYRNNNINGFSTYNAVSASSSGSIVQNTKGLELIACVAYSTALNSKMVGFSEDLGVTWSWSAISSYADNYVTSIFRLLIGGRSNLISAQLYDKLPASTIAETKTWVESNAGALTQ